MVELSNIGKGKYTVRYMNGMGMGKPAVVFLIHGFFLICCAKHSWVHTQHTFQHKRMCSSKIDLVTWGGTLPSSSSQHQDLSLTSFRFGESKPKPSFATKIWERDIIQLITSDKKSWVIVRSCKQTPNSEDENCRYSR